MMAIPTTIPIIIAGNKTVSGCTNQHATDRSYTRIKSLFPGFTPNRT